jgi:DNA polymerase
MGLFLKERYGDMELSQDVELNRAVLALLLAETAHELRVWGRVQADLGASYSPRSEAEPLVFPASGVTSARSESPVNHVAVLPTFDPLMGPVAPSATPTSSVSSNRASGSVKAAKPVGTIGCFDLYRSLQQNVSSDVAPADKSACQADIRHRIEICRLCPLGTRRAGILAGYGPLDARIMFVGAGGNPHELEEGRMMTGEAAVLMDNIIAAMHSCNAAITKESIYYSNIIKCCATPAGPQRAAVAKMCVRYLREEVRLVQPKVILIWGQMAYSAMFGDDTNIISVRGQMRRFEQIPAIATHHPLECIRSPKLKGPVWNDVRTVLSLLKPSSPVSGGVAGERPPHGG